MLLWLLQNCELVLLLKSQFKVCIHSFHCSTMFQFEIVCQQSHLRQRWLQTIVRTLMLQSVCSIFQLLILILTQNKFSDLVDVESYTPYSNLLHSVEQTLADLTQTYLPRSTSHQFFVPLSFLVISLPDAKFSSTNIT